MEPGAALPQGRAALGAGQPRGTRRLAGRTGPGGTALPGAGGRQEGAGARPGRGPAGEAVGRDVSSCKTNPPPFPVSSRPPRGRWRRARRAPEPAQPRPAEGAGGPGPRGGGGGLAGSVSCSWNPGRTPSLLPAPPPTPPPTTAGGWARPQPRMWIEHLLYRGPGVGGGGGGGGAVFSLSGKCSSACGFIYLQAIGTLLLGLYIMYLEKLRFSKDEINHGNREAVFLSIRRRLVLHTSRGRDLGFGLHVGWAPEPQETPHSPPPPPAGSYPPDPPGPG